MKLEIVKSEGLAHSSYYISDQGEAVVIDPRRDCEIYTELAKKDCAKIEYILETHRNEDYVIGSVELQNMTEAQIGHSKALPFKYGDHNLVDSETIGFGSTTIKVIHTPGHTDESLCYALIPSESKEVLLAFTGDTLFAGSVGRTDLYGKTVQQKQAEKLYDSIYEKLLPLGDHVLVYPAHGMGSICGNNISPHDQTSIGFEKKTNSYLKLNKEEFIKKSENEELVVPRYFKKMEEYNLNGPPLLSELSYPKPFSLKDFEEEMREPLVMVIDTRMPYAYAGSHIPNSLNIWLGGTSVYPGWILDTKQFIIFVNERPSDIDIVASQFRRLGFDNMRGYLCGGMNQWQEAGKQIRHTDTISVTELKNKLETSEVVVLDVREPSEWKEDGTIKEAKRIFFPNLPEHIDSLPRDLPIAVMCSVGKRASIAMSMLERAGFLNMSNVLGGMTAWEKLDYPIRK